MCLYAYREGSLLPTTGSLLSSCTRTLAVFQYSKPETLERKARPSNPVARPTDQPTNRPTSPPSRPLSLASVHRTVIFGQNRTVSYLNVSLGAPPLPLPSFLPPAVGSHMHAVFQRRQAFSSYSSTPLDREMEAVSALPWISSLSLSLLFPFFWEGRGKDRFFFRICFAERGREREEEGLVIRTGTLLRDIFVGCISN